MYDLHSEPIDIRVKVQEHKLHYNGVSVECNDHAIFCGADGQKAKMIEDLHFQWPFRATIRGVGAPDVFELRMPCYGMHGETWVPATINCQREDGFFEATAFQYGNGHWNSPMNFPAVARHDIRDTATGAPPSMPECMLSLHVPEHEPLKASLSKDDGEQITYSFGRPSPAPPAKGLDFEAAKIHFKVSQDRKVVTADVGHSTLSHFVSGEVRTVSQEFARMKHSWRFQLGPLAEHTVEVVKKYTLGSIITLLVDGEVLVEAAAADLGLDPKSKEWKCDFSFVGERLLDFEVYKTNTEGTILNQTGHSEQLFSRYSHKCTVVIPNDWEFSTGICRADTAQLFIDGQAFSNLPMVMPKHAEPNLTIDPRALMHLYGIATPYVVDPSAPNSLVVLTNNVLEQADMAKQAVTGLLSANPLWHGCCRSPNNDEAGDVIEVDAPYIEVGQVLTTEVSKELATTLEL